LALTPGTRLGVYEVTAQIGEGGMGQVFRARDTKLNRDVALKILPDPFASDSDRLTRFTREAQTLAALNHPNIAHIHGLEESGGITALVMELVEGEDLSQRIARGAIPLEEALPIAKQIAEALEAAHEQGIIHRDLKPANIKVRTDGTVKVLDFGLAKAIDPVSALSTDASQSPTLTSPAMTQMGMILGTAAYMAPEQAKGRAVDRRADIWAFGCVLYEMLNGKRAFGGEDVSDTLANVLKSEPDWTALPALMPIPIRRLLRRSVEKDRKRRLDSAAAARLEIDEAITAPATGEGVAPVVLAAPRWRRVLPWAVAAVAFIAAVTTLFLWVPWRKASPPAPLRVSAELGADVSLVIAEGASAPAGNAAVVSPDGSQLAFVARPHGGGAPRLYVRRLDQLTATPLAGTENAVGPFFSPDGQWLGFFGGGTLKKIAVTGGTPVTLADVTNARGGSWAEDETIVFSPGTQRGGSLWRVPAADGTAERLTTLAQGEGTHRWPQVLPGGRAVLYTVSAIVGDLTNAWLAVQPPAHRHSAYRPARRLLRPLSP